MLLKYVFYVWKCDIFLLFLLCSARRTLLSNFSIWFSTRFLSYPPLINQSLIILIWALNSEFVEPIFWHVVLGHKLCFLLTISNVPNSGDWLVFYKVFFVVYYQCLCAIEHLKIIFLFLNTWKQTILVGVFGLASR